MTRCRAVASSSLFHRYYLDELVELVSFPLPYSRSTRYVDSIHNLAVSIPRLWKEIYANSFFPCIIRQWNFLPAYCFPLTYNLNRFKTNMNRYLFIYLLIYLFIYLFIYSLFIKVDQITRNVQ